MSKEWFVFYTKSRQEKKVDELLRKRGFKSYLPLQMVMRQWSDRKKKIEVPLFNSYIFVQMEEHAITEVLQVPGVAWNIRLDDKPAILHVRELDTIKRFIETGLLLETHGVQERFAAGDRIEVVDGPLKGLEGVLIDNQSKHFFSMLLESIGQVITVQINPQIIRKIPGGKPVRI
jgi:transcription termination/antitermination protein NusG